MTGSAPTVSKRTLATSLVERLREAILSGELLPGSRLRLDELRERFGVSLSPLREAMSRLGSEGLVLIEDQRGYRVAPVSAVDLAEVIRLRKTLETEALREAIRLGDARWEASLVSALHLLRRQETGPQGPDRVQQWERLHRELHTALISACGSPLLLQFCAMLHDRNDRYRRLFLAHRTVDASVSQEHEQIILAALERDVARATGCLADHIERTAQYVHDVLDSQQREDAPARGGSVHGA